MKVVILKKLKVNAFVLYSNLFNLEDILINCGPKINEYLNNKNYSGIVHIENICDKQVVYAVGSIGSCWKIVQDTFGDATPLGEIKAVIVGVEGKDTIRHIFIPDCSDKTLKKRLEK